jgi:hypothetical protein
VLFYQPAMLEKEQVIQSGVIAQEVQKAAQEVGTIAGV